MNDAVFDADLFDRHMLRTLQLLGGCSRNTLITAVPGGTSPRCAIACSASCCAGTVASRVATPLRAASPRAAARRRRSRPRPSSARARTQQAISALTPPRRYTNAAIDPHSSPLSLSGFNVSPRPVVTTTSDTGTKSELQQYSPHYTHTLASMALCPATSASPDVETPQFCRGAPGLEVARARDDAAEVRILSAAGQPGAGVQAGLRAHVPGAHLLSSRRRRCWSRTRPASTLQGRTCCATLPRSRW